jgi:hypothetical protein
MIADANGPAPTSSSVSSQKDGGTPAGAPAPEIGSTWFLRVGAACAVIGAALGRVVAPGLRGNASEKVVVFWDRASAIGAYAMSCALVGVALHGIFEVARRPKIGLFARIVSIGGVGIVVATVVSAFQRRLPVALAVLMAVAASFTVVAGAVTALRSAHTRAVGAVLALLASAAIVRLVAWELAVVAGDHASERLYGWSRGIATGAVVLEGLGQLVAAAWLGTRTRLMGQILSSVAVAVAFVMTWGAAQGMQPGAAPWQAVLHTALGEAAGIPPPFGLGAIATFLVAASILFAFVALVQRWQVAAVTCALSLALIGRGSFDAPLRALSAITAAVWLMLAVTDDRSMWRGLLADRPRD